MKDRVGSGQMAHPRSHIPEHLSGSRLPYPAFFLQKPALSEV
jgi:hypothetical protein